MAEEFDRDDRTNTQDNFNATAQMNQRSLLGILGERNGTLPYKLIVQININTKKSDKDNDTDTDTDTDDDDDDDDGLSTSTIILIILGILLFVIIIILFIKFKNIKEFNKFLIDEISSLENSIGNSKSDNK